MTAPADEVALIEGAAAEYITMSPAIAARLEPLAAGGPLARAVAAQLLAQTHKPALMERARQLADDARAATGGLSGRERHLVEASWHWTRGDVERTLAQLDAVVTDHPTDLHTLRSRYLLQFATGRLDAMLAGVQAVRPAWAGAGLPLASYLDGMESFALEENGRYDEAEPLGRQGVAADPDDLWAIHAVAHVLEMEQRRDEGVAWIGRDNSGLEGRTGFAGHLWWHQALALWALGRHDDALDSFDRHIYPGRSEEGLDLTNAIALLARLDAAGADVGTRWERLVAPAQVRMGQHSHPFNDTHMVLGLSRAGRHDEVAAMLAGMTAWSTRTDDHAADVLRRVGLDVAHGLAAYGRGLWREAVTHLAPATDQWWRLGGSHAQRQLYRVALDTAEARS
ncbi:MAG: hypothetical protein R2761_11595 [Acidimicrobiales bacterium]